MKWILPILVAALFILGGLMAIHRCEGKIGAYPDNLFTYSGGVTWSNPQPTDQIFRGHRWHFGYPCWALYIDVSDESTVWYAKLDAAPLIANALCAVALATFLVLLARRPKFRHEADNPS